MWTPRRRSDRAFCLHDVNVVAIVQLFRASMLQALKWGSDVNGTVMYSAC